MLVVWHCFWPLPWQHCCAMEAHSASKLVVLLAILLFDRQARCTGRPFCTNNTTAKHVLESPCVTVFYRPDLHCHISLIWGLTPARCSADDNIINLRASSRTQPDRRTNGNLSLSLSKGVVYDQNAARRLLERLRKALDFETVPVRSLTPAIKVMRFCCSLRMCMPCR